MRLPSCAPSFRFSKPVWLPRIIKSCPKMAKAPRLHATRAPRSMGQTFPGAFQTRRRTAGARTVLGARHAAQQLPHRSGPRTPWGATSRRLLFAAVWSRRRSLSGSVCAKKIRSKGA
jgi:hypothetical protein